VFTALVTYHLVFARLYVSVMQDLYGIDVNVAVSAPIRTEPDNVTPTVEPL